MTVSELVFDKEHYLDIDKARMQHLDLLGIDCRGTTLLDVGCGIGRFSDYWTAKECKVLGIDGREANIKVMRERYPHIDASVANVESETFLQLGPFDVVFCYGLLYHTENPTLVLRNLSAMAQEILMLETASTASREPVVKFVLEHPGEDQAMRSVACRPSEAYLVMILSQCGFQHIYMPTVWPKHPEFSRREYASAIDGASYHLTRTIIIASNQPIENTFLASADNQLFIRHMGQLERAARRIIARGKRLGGLL